jgi:isochorismate synthase
MSAERLGDAFDLLAGYDPGGGSFFDRGGRGVVGSPGGDRVAAAGVPASLRAMAPGAVALGALPFVGEGTLAIPSAGARRSEAGVERIGSGPLVLGRIGGASPAAAFVPPQLLEIPSADGYADAVRTAVARIEDTELRKVVLARTIEVDAGRVLDPRRLAHRLRAVDPHAATFAVPVDGGVLVGASPELLVSRAGREVRSNPLAGSAPRSGDPTQDGAFAEELAASAKDREEHRIVVDDVARVLGPLCTELTWDPEPVLLETPNVWHLSTRFRGILAHPTPGVLELVAALQPTPAVAGVPRSDALATIDELEPFDRGCYAGPVGWVDATGDGAWAIALRCAVLDGARATLYAGAGIVADSRPEAEVDETARKFRAFLDALRWG